MLSLNVRGCRCGGLVVYIYIVIVTRLVSYLFGSLSPYIYIVTHSLIHCSYWVAVSYLFGVLSPVSHIGLYQGCVF